MITAQFSWKKSFVKFAVYGVLSFAGFALQGALASEPQWANITVGSVLVGALAFLRNVAKVRFGAPIP